MFQTEQRCRKIPEILGVALRNESRGINAFRSDSQIDSEANVTCVAGLELLSSFEEAVGQRADARDRLLVAFEKIAECEQNLSVSKTIYFDALVAWITHRGICKDCSVSSVQKDRTQFASF